ncbi:Magnesium transport protein CorA [Planctomycetes bacterium Pan216]|uniref:Magnesium transport protein CorA n=1 Tax=Kolteria novifilia TaxID=2527975 RepID=A0A518BBX4_9BACT|nr:Magnesium transport protein CorA [Planctomycetes bacterium Pan216]
MTTAIAFDFDTKHEERIPADKVPEFVRDGKCCWIDLDPTQEDAREILKGLGVPRMVRRDVFADSHETRYQLFAECLHFTAHDVRYVDGTIGFSPIDVIVGERFVVTLTRGPSEVTKNMRRIHSQDFHAFAKTLSFILYEFWDQTLDGYRRVVHAIELDVQRAQEQILTHSDDPDFEQAAGMSIAILELRKHILSSREVLDELATRRSPFISESTQPYLGNMVSVLDRFASDLSVEREVLAEALQLHMGIVSHRTNRVLNRLTIISAIFLPLTFLCGVYGMNFEHLPEVGWRYGYYYFWGLCVTIAGSLFAAMRMYRWL